MQRPGLRSGLARFVYIRVSFYLTIHSPRLVRDTALMLGLRCCGQRWMMQASLYFIIHVEVDDPTSPPLAAAYSSSSSSVHALRCTGQATACGS